MNRRPQHQWVNRAADDAGGRAVTDSQLMTAAEGGSVRAFGALYDRYCGQAYQVARSACANAGHAEEVVHEAFISIWRDRASYHEQAGSVAAWLLTAVLDRARASDQDRVPTGPADKLRTQPATQRRPEPVQMRADAGRLRALLERLPDAERDIITLALYGGLTHAEIAARLELPAETVKGRMRLGLEKIRADTEREVA